MMHIRLWRLWIADFLISPVHLLILSKKNRSCQIRKRALAYSCLQMENGRDLLANEGGLTLAVFWVSWCDGRWIVVAYCMA